VITYLSGSSKAIAVYNAANRLTLAHKQNENNHYILKL